MKAAEKEAHDAHFTVDKQNIALWPREPPPKQALSLHPRKPLTIRVVLICLSLVVVASIVLQAILYPWFMGTISDVNTNAQMLKSRVDNMSTLGSEIEKNSGSVKVAGVQIQMVNASLDNVHSQVLILKTSVEKANAQIQSLRKTWEEVDHLNAKIPELKRDLDKASALNAMVRALQSRLDSINKLLRRQSDILQMVSQGWKFFRENFYYFSHISKTWYSAEQFCMSKDSHLTSVTSRDEQEFLYKGAGGLPNWIGLTKAGSEGKWYWVDDTPFNKESVRFWLPGEPNNVGNSEHCASIKVSSLQSWNDDSCDNKLLFICKQPYIQSEP
ncbi:C-type lectin domain family 4 member K [Heterocephalus glaber]|uniref:C-type lectin domain family 4 member K n=1 Tax=Heterocephalus glaber TaxID=10181 RepID=A0A0P6J2W2_HETGA|nr:C-type lectin domain family 4 member K [Heterocephalus glaber]